MLYAHISAPFVLQEGCKFLERAPLRLASTRSIKPQLRRLSNFHKQFPPASRLLFSITPENKGDRANTSAFIKRPESRKGGWGVKPNSLGALLGPLTFSSHLTGPARFVCFSLQVKILAIDDGVPAKTATATLTVIVQDINDNAPTFLKDYRPVLQEHSQPRKVVEILATDDDDRSKSNGPPFTFRMDPNADDIIRASFKIEHDQSEF